MGAAVNVRAEIVSYRKMLRVARTALQRIRDYEAGAHTIARNALREIDEVCVSEPESSDETSGG